MRRTRPAGGMLILRRVGYSQPFAIRSGDIVEVQPCEPVGPYRSCSQIWTNRAGWLRITAPYLAVLDSLQRLGHPLADLSAETPAPAKRRRGRPAKK